jgi:uncharacterized protein (DUF2249 family)
MPLDVRNLAPRDRHATIFQTWQGLAEGEALLLVNDHDPLPLYYQFVCEHGGTFHWEYLEPGPQTWRVRITRGDYPDPGFRPVPKMAAIPPEAGVSGKPLQLDLRPIFARGETPCTAIDAAAARVGAGQTLVLLVPFQPVPLYAKLGRQGFSADTQRLEDGTWKVVFTRERCVTAGETEACGCAEL